MPHNGEPNLAYKAVLAVAVCLLGSLGLRAVPSAPLAEPPAPPPPRPPEIHSLLLPAAPAQGKGRMAMTFAGNRRWCTNPDDRVVQPIEKPGSRPKRNEVYTFGYKFI